MKMKRPLRAMLSILLSVLMLTTSVTCGITVFAASVDATQAVEEDTLAGALTDYAKDATDNNRFRVLRALGPVVSALTVKLSSQPSVNNGELKGGTAGANFMGELRDAVIAQAGAGGDEAKIALINEFIPTVGGTGEFRSLSNYRKAEQGSGLADFVLDENVGDVTVSAKREAFDAIADFDADSIGSKVETEYSITYHCAVWQKAAVSYTTEDDAITGASTASYEFYYFTAKPTIEKGTTDVSAEKAVIDTFIDLFGANEKDYKGSSMGAYIKDPGKLYGLDNIAALSEEGEAAFMAAVDLGYEWWGNFISSEWLNTNVFDFLAEIDAAMYARALAPAVAKMNAAVDAGYEIADKADFRAVAENYLNLKAWSEHYKALLSQSDLKTKRAAAALGELRDWEVYTDALQAMYDALRAAAFRFVTDDLRVIFAELEAAMIDEAEISAQYNEQYLAYVDSYLAQDEEAVTEPAADGEEAAAPEEFHAKIDYYKDTLSDERLCQILGVVAGASQAINQIADFEEVEAFWNETGVNSFEAIGETINTTLNARGYDEIPASALEAENAARIAYTFNVNKTVDELKAYIDEANAARGDNAELNSLLSGGISAAEDLLFIALSRPVYDAKDLYDLEGEVNAVNGELLKDAVKSIDEDLYAYLANGSDYAKSLITGPARSTAAPVAGLVLIAHAADGFDGVYDAVTGTVAAAAASFSRVNLEVSGTDYYTIRRGDTNNDIARTTGEDYNVTNTRVGNTISALDRFLSSSDITNLINLEKTNPDGTTEPYTFNGHNVRNINELINAILCEKLYSDEIMNTLIGAIYPMICNLIKTKLSSILFNTDGKGSVYDPINLTALNLEASSGIFYARVKGSAKFYLNGPQSTAKFVNLLSNNGLDIYPSTLANHMGAFPKVQSALRSAANWTPNDSNTRYDLFGNFPGDWQGVNYATGDVNGYNPYIYSLIDGDYELDPAKMDWDIDGSEARFTTALSAVIDSILPVARIVLGGKTNYVADLGNAVYVNGDGLSGEAKAEWTLTGTHYSAGPTVKPDIYGWAGASISLKTKHSNGAVLYGYRDILAPVFEALGLDNYSYSPMAMSSYRPGTDSAASVYVNGLVQPLKRLIDQVTHTPVDKILSILPNLAYALRSDFLSELLNNLQLDLGVNIRIERFDRVDLGDGVGDWFNLTSVAENFRGRINGALPNISQTVNIGEYLDLADLLDVENVTDINVILRGLLAKSDNPKLQNLVTSLPTINQTQLSQLGTLGNPSSERTYGTRYFVTADKPDVLWWLLKYVGQCLTNQAFQDAVKEMIISGEDDDTTMIDSILSMIGSNPDAVGAALIELFNPIEYRNAEYTQWTPAKATTPALVNQSGAAYVYLKYGNDWTYDKAKTLVEGTNEIMSTLLKKTFEEEGYDTFGDWLDSKIGKGLSEKNITNFIETLVGIGDGIDNYQLNYILSRVTTSGLNLHAWGNAFGYLYDDAETAAEDLHPQPGQDGYDGTTFSRLSATKTTETDPETEEAVEKIVWTIRDTSGVTHSFIEVDDKTALTSEQMAQNRETYQLILGYILQPLSPIIDTLLSDKDAVIFPQSASDTVGLLKLLGNNGYDNAIIPLFEGLGVPSANIKTQSEFNALNTYDAKLDYIMNTVLDFLESLYGDSATKDNIINNAMEQFIPYLLQFVQSNGLSVVVRQLLKPVLTTVDTVRPILGINVNYVVDYLADDILGQLLSGPDADIEFDLKNIATITAPTNGLNLRDLTFTKLADVLGKIVNKANGATAGSENYLDLSPLTYGIDNIISLEHSSATSKSATYTTRTLFTKTGSAEYNKTNAANVLTVAVSLALDFVMEGSNLNAISSLLGRLLGEETAVEIDKYINIFDDIKEVLRDSGSVEAFLSEPNWFYINGSSKGSDDTIVLPARIYYYLRYGRGTDTDVSKFDPMQLPDEVNLWTSELAHQLINSIPELADMAVSMLMKDQEDAPETASALLTSVWDKYVGNAFSPKTIGSLAETIYGFIPEAVMNFKAFLNVFLNVDLDTWVNKYFEDQAKVDEEGNPVIDQETGEQVVEKVLKEAYTSEEPYATVDEFSAALAELLTPLDEILSWLLTGKDYKFFYSKTTPLASDANAKDQIVLGGGQGYARGLVPILEAFGCEPAPLQAGDTGVKVLTYSITAILQRLEGIVKSDDPVNAVLDILPNLLYFINANGLTSSILNLVAPIGSLAVALAPTLFGGEEPLIEIDSENIDVQALVEAIESADNSRDKFVALIDAILVTAIPETVVLPENFSVGKIDMETVLDTVKALTGIEIHDAVTMKVEGTNGFNYLDNFYYGDIRKADSANGLLRYTANFTDATAESKADLLTILIYTIFDVLNYKDAEGNYPNDLAIGALIDKDAPEEAAAKVAAVRDLLHVYIDENYGEYDWFYFNEGLKDMTDETAAEFYAALASGEADLSEYATTMSYILESYLSYDEEGQTNLWNGATAARVRDSVKDIIDMVVAKIVESDDDESNDSCTTANAFLNNLWDNNNPLDKRLEYTIGGVIANLLKNLDNDTLLDLIGAVLDVPESDWREWKSVISQYEGVTDPATEISDADNTKYTPKQFVKKILAMVKPVGRILDWLLMGKDIQVFYLNDNSAAIDLQGINGFEESLLPILEVLNCDLGDARIDNLSGVDALELTLNALIDKLEAVLNSEDPVGTIADMIPQILYFIQTNGLSVSIKNLLTPVQQMLEKVNEIADTEISVDVVELLNLNEYGIENLDSFKLKDVFAIVEGILAKNDINVKVYDALTKDGVNFLDTFAVGKLVKKTSTVNDRTYYTMEYNDDMDSMALFTILLCSAVDVFKYEDNKEALANLIFKDDPNAVEKFEAILDLMVTTIDENAFLDYDWFYFDRENVNAESFPNVGDKVPVSYEKSTMGYLEYNNNWNLETAKYIQDQFYGIVDTVMKNATEYDTLNALIKDKWSGINLYNWDTVNKLGGAIGGFVGDLDEAIQAVISIALDVDLNTWDKYVNAENTGTMTKEQFIDEVINIVSPVDFLLDWLLAGKEIKLLYTKDGYELTDGATAYDAIRIEGAKGFENALIPILEALNVDLSDIAALGEAPSGLDELRYVLTKLLDEIDAIAADDDTVKAIIAKIPNLLYFINANGLSIAVRNLLVPVTGLLDDVATLIDKPEYASLQSIVDELLKDNEKLSGAINVEDLSITGILKIVEALTGLEIIGSVTYKGVNLFETFAIGEVERIDSANGNTAYKMDYVPNTLGEDNSPLAYIDVLAILVAAAVNIVRNDNNKAALVNLFGENGENTYVAVRNVLNLKEEDIDYEIYKWLFTIKNYTKPNPKYDVVSPMKRSVVFGKGYDQYWTKEKANYVAANLNKVIDNTMRLLGIRINGIDLSDLESTLEYLLADFAYTTGNMDKISSKVLEYIGKIDEIDPDGHIKALIKTSLGVDLTEFDKYKDGYDWKFESGDRDGFIDAIIEFASPLYPLLRWLLLDEEIAFFNDVDKTNLIVLPGGQGYNKAIIPLLEAFDYKNGNIKTLDQYKADIAADPDNMLRDILNPLLDFVDYITEDPLNHLLDRLPALIYFINSMGLDTAFKNVLHPVYVILHAIEPLVKVDLYEVLHFDLSTMDMEYIIRMLINRFLPDYADEITDPVLDAIAELTLGKLVKFTSKNGENAFTMEYVEDEEAQMAGKADMITVILRLALKWLTLPENQETVKKMIRENIPNAETRDYVLATYDTFIEYLAKPYGISMMMGLAYYVFFGWDVASEKTLERLDETNDNWKFMIGMIDGSEDAYIQSFADMMHKMFGFTKDVVDEDGVVSHGFIPMFQKIINWLKALIEWFKNLFNK